MERYKHSDYNQTKMIPLRFADQIQPGTFEYTLNHVVDNDLDMSLFESRHCNGYNCAPADDSAIRVKIILFAYSRGITSGRKAAQACLKMFCLWRCQRTVGLTTASLPSLFGV